MKTGIYTKPELPKVRKEYCTLKSSIYDYEEVLHSDYYFGLYLFASDENSQRLSDKYTAIKSTNVGLKFELKFKTISVESLSTPHMERYVNLWELYERVSVRFWSASKADIGNDQNFERVFRFLN